MRLCVALLTLFWPRLLVAANWQLVWSQEFNDPAGTAADPTWWNQETGGGGWGNGELECYTAGTSNAFEDGAGNLVIQARNESACGGANSYDSARLTTQNKFEIYCGRIEARAWVPAGQGLWPAFWMLGRNIGSVGWPACGETDIMETVDQPQNWIQGSLHMTGDNYSWWGQSHLPSGAYSDGYHVFTCYWTPTSITYAMDGTNYYTATQGGPPNWPFNQPSFILMNLAVGGGWPGAPNGATVFPADYKIDYVRVYKDTNLVGPYNGVTVNIPGRVENENYDDGGYGLAYMDSDPANKGGAYRLNEWVDIEADPSDSNGNNLCWTTGGEWDQYTVNATQAGSYQVSFRVASAGAGGTYHLTADGVDVTGPLTAPNTGGWHTWSQQVAGPFTLSAGTHVLRLVLDGVGPTGSVANFDCMDFSLAAPSPTPSATPSGSPTPSATASASPSPTPSATATLSASATASLSPSPSPSASATPPQSATPTFTVSPPFSATVSPSVSASPTVSVTGSVSPTPTATASPSVTVTVSPSWTASATATPSPSLTATATASLTASQSATVPPSPSTTATATASASPVPSATPTLPAALTATASPTARPSVSPTQLASATPTAPATAEGGGLRVDQVEGLPNPNPGALEVHLTAPAESLELRVYSVAWVRVVDLRVAAQGAGWQSVPLRLPARGVYYAVVTARRGQAQARSRPALLMRTD